MLPKLNEDGSIQFFLKQLLDILECSQLFTYSLHLGCDDFILIFCFLFPVCLSVLISIATQRQKPGVMQLVLL